MTAVEADPPLPVLFVGNGDSSVDYILKAEICMPLTNMSVILRELYLSDEVPKIRVLCHFALDVLRFPSHLDLQIKSPRMAGAENYSNGRLVFKPADELTDGGPLNIPLRNPGLR